MCGSFLSVFFVFIPGKLEYTQYARGELELIDMQIQGHLQRLLVHRLVSTTERETGKGSVFHVTLNSAHIWQKKKGLIHVNCQTLLQRALIRKQCTSSIDAYL